MWLWSHNNSNRASICVHQSQVTSKMGTNKCGGNGMIMWIHIPIHSTWRLCNTCYMFGEKVETIPCGFGASMTPLGNHFVCTSDPGFQLCFQNQNHVVCISDPSFHLKNLKLGRTIVMVMAWWCGSISPSTAYEGCETPVIHVKCMW